MGRPTFDGSLDERTRAATQSTYDRTPSEWEALDSGLETYPMERVVDGPDDSSDRMIAVPDEQPDRVQVEIAKILAKGIPQPDLKVGSPGCRLRRQEGNMSENDLHEENTWETEKILEPN